jgi:hypothetical protein
MMVRPRRVKWAWVVAALIVVAVVALLFVFSTTGVTTARLRNPLPQPTYTYGGAPRAVRPLWGVTNWPLVVEIITVLVAAGCWFGFALASWRQRRIHPGIYLMVGATGMVLFDPVMDWATFAVFDPRLLHIPASWPYASLTPGVEPLFVFAGWPVYLVIPGVIAAAAHRRWVQPRLNPGRWLGRHSVVTAYLVGLVVAVPFDVAAEFAMARTDVWCQTQLPGPVVHAGAEQWAIFWEPLLLCPVMAVAAALLARDASGVTTLNRVVLRSPRLSARPVAGRVLMAWGAMAVILVGYYIGGMAIIRLGGFATHVNIPFPYQDMKVYDPQGLYQKAGVPGPYYRGAWSGRW